MSAATPSPAAAQQQLAEGGGGEAAPPFIVRIENRCASGQLERAIGLSSLDLRTTQFQQLTTGFTKSTRRDQVMAPITVNYENVDYVIPIIARYEPCDKRFSYEMRKGGVVPFLQALKERAKQYHAIHLTRAHNNRQRYVASLVESE